MGNKFRIERFFVVVFGEQESNEIWKIFMAFDAIKYWNGCSSLFWASTDNKKC